MRTILLLFLSISICLQLYGQEFAPIGAKWTFESSIFGEGPGSSTYVSLRDTMIGGETFRIVDKEVETCNINYPGYNYFRQSSDSIFWMHEFYPQQQLLFDMGAEKGDSWFVPHHNTSPFYEEFASQYQLVVDSVYTTTFFPNTPVKTFDVSLYLADIDSSEIYTTASRFYEHIGFEVALLPRHFDGICDAEVEVKFRCYSDSQIGEIKLVDESCIVSVTDDEFVDDEYKIQPNPVHSSFSITDLDLSSIDISIYSMDGMEIDFEKTDNVIYLTDLSAGIYLVSFIQGDRRFIRKLVVK